MKRFLLWLLINGAFASCAWLGVNGNIGAGRVFVFFAWLMAIMYSLCSLVPEEKKVEIRKHGRSVPSWVSHGFDISICCLLIWHGWWFTGVAVILMTLAELGIYGVEKK